MNLIKCARAYRLLLGKLRIGYSFLSLDFSGTAMKSVRAQMQMEGPLDIAQVALYEIRMAALAVELQMILTITQLLQTESLKNGCQWVTVKTISFPELLAKVRSTDPTNPKSVEELHSILSEQ